MADAVTKEKKSMTLGARSSKRNSADLMEPEDESCLGTPEEIAQDNAEWDAIVANTTPEKIAFLKQMYADQLKRGAVTPLDFTDK